MIKGIIITAIAAVVLLMACNDEPQETQHPFPAEKTSEEKGAMLFKEKCALCHSKTQDIAGPALQGVMARWDNDPVRLKAFIRNSAKSIESGDPSAVRTFEKYRAAMPSFPSFTEEEMNDIVAYLKD